MAPYVVPGLGRPFQGVREKSSFLKSLSNMSIILHNVIYY